MHTELKVLTDVDDLTSPEARVVIWWLGQNEPTTAAGLALLQRAQRSSTR